MKRTPVSPDLTSFPAQFHAYLQNANLFDSSCSAAARVWYIDKSDGFYLKKAQKGTLAREAAMTAYFHGKGLAAEVLAYESLDEDWMLTRRIPGEDCTHAMYTADPVRLCDIQAALLRSLHETDFSGCPVPDRTSEYLATAKHNFENQHYDINLFPDNWGYSTPEEAWDAIKQTGHLLQTDTLLHGDYCLPNILLDNWKFSGYIDLDTAGVGDRHVDLFWAVWSLQFNLKTDKYRERFLDAYGRDKITPELLRTVAAIEVFG